MSAALAKLRLAWRDLWAQGRRSAFFALLVAAGVASLVGVQGMSRSLEDSLRSNARQMIQGDVVITRSQELTLAQKDALHALDYDGAQVTEIVQASAHAAAHEGHALIELKVVDPAVWPFYGGLRTSPEGVRPGKGEALVGPELLTNLKLNVGDSFAVGKSQVKIVGTVLEEPRPLDAQPPMGPRVLVSQASFPEPAPGYLEQVLIKLPATLSSADVKARLLSVFDERAVQTSEDAWQSFGSIMDKLFTFLSLIALTSLLVGGLGVAMAMRTFIGQKLEQIAVLKALGATSGTVMGIFLAEAALLGIGGSLAGAGVGLGMQLFLPRLFAGLIPVPAGELNWIAALSGFAAGVAIAVLSALMPVRAIRAIKPVALFRGDAGGKMGWKAWAEALLVGGLTVAGVAWLALTYAKSAAVGLGFLGGLVAATLLLFLLSWMLLRLLRLLPQSGRPSVRHAVRSLNAPGNQSASIVVAMGLGIMLMTAVYLIQTSLISEIKTAGVGPDTPNLFVMSHKADQRADLVRALEADPQVQKVSDVVLAADGEVLSVDGKSPADLGVQGGDRPEMISGTPVQLPKGIKVLDGQWFTAANRGQRHLTVLDAFATTYNMRVGSTVVLRIKGQSLSFIVTSIYGPSGDGMISMHLGRMAAAPGVLDPYADSYMVTAVTSPNREDAVIGRLLASHPEAMPVSLGAYVKLIESLMTRWANILRFLSAFAVIAAGVILSGSLSATRFRRRKEAALLKSLGASRLTVAAASGLENGLLGVVAGLAGGGLALGMVQAAGMAQQLRLDLSLAPLGMAALAGGLLAMLVGVGSTLDVLRVKPLSVLRSE